MRTIAFYLPQFHPIPENDLWWGKGFTEWRNVTRVGPVFEGHHQPQLPSELGFYDLRVPETREAQAELARAHGISGFCYYYYWFDGKKLLQRPLEEVVASGKPDFPFCVCWANENWTRRWDGGESNVLAEQKYSGSGDREFIRTLIPVFQDRRYIRVAGKPLLLVYRTELFPDPRRTAEIWREEAAKAGIELYLMRGEGFSACNPESIGFDAAYEFPPIGLPVDLSFDRAGVRIYRPEEFSGRLHDYRKLVNFMTHRDAPDYVRFHGVMAAWDNTARRKTNADIFVNSDPNLYWQWLSDAVKKTSQLPDERQLIFINAWNEWAEGCHLEPDLRYQRAYLEATSAAVSGQPFVFKSDDRSHSLADASPRTSEAPASVEPTKSLAAQRNEIHALWNSWSWRMFRPLRNLLRQLKGQPKETEPMTVSILEAARTVSAIRGSLSWRLTAPFRMVHRALGLSAYDADGAYPLAYQDDVQKWNQLQPIIEREAAKFSVVGEIHRDDHMFGFMMGHPSFDSDEARVQYYFKSGDYSAGQVAELLASYCGGLGRKPEVLEFASGYGCVTRHLVLNKEIELESCDIHPAAIDFLQTRLGVGALQSSPVPESLSFPHQFDFVFVLSFFSHMPITTWTRWLVRLTQGLRPGGLIVFTTHGMACRVMHGNPEIGPTGFWFTAQSEQSDLSTEQYGSTIVTEDFIRKTALTIPSVELVESRLAYWWGLQDLYILRKNT